MGGPGEEDPERINPEHGEKKVTGILIVAKEKKYLTLVSPRRCARAGLPFEAAFDVPEEVAAPEDRLRGSPPCTS